MVNFALASADAAWRARLTKNTNDDGYGFPRVTGLHARAPSSTHGAGGKIVFKQMLKREQSAYRQWLVDYLREQIRSRALTRAEAVEQIREAADRAVLADPQSAAQAEAIAREMIAALPYADPTGEGREPG